MTTSHCDTRQRKETILLKNISSFSIFVFLKKVPSYILIYYFLGKKNNN